LIGKKAVSEKSDPYAVIIPAEQKDKYTTKWLIDVLQTGGVEVHSANSRFNVDGKEYGAGSAIIYMNQPYGSFAKTMLEKQEYPEIREYPGGPLKRPYDVVAHTLPLMMGIDVAWIKDKFTVDTQQMAGAIVPEPVVTDEEAPNGFIMSHETNGMYIAVNRFLKNNIPVSWTTESFVDGDKEYPAGTVIIKDSGENADLIRSTARELNVDLAGRSSSANLAGFNLNPVRLGLYKSWSGNMEEGWTRWVMEKFEMPFETLHNDDVISGSLNDKFNVIMFSNDNERSIVDGRSGNTPPEYTGGIGTDGVNNLKSFVRNGGTIITYGSANDFMINRFNLRVSKVNLPRSSFNIPGSILKVTNNVNHPVAYGLPKEGSGFFRGGAAFNVSDGKVITRYSNTNEMLISGWAEGTALIKGKANIVEVSYGKGRIILIGINPIYRAQVHDSFKYLFNSMFYGAENAPATKD
jgi:hypothetical protein